MQWLADGLLHEPLQFTRLMPRHVRVLDLDYLIPNRDRFVRSRRLWLHAIHRRGKNRRIEKPRAPDCGPKSKPPFFLRPKLESPRGNQQTTNNQLLHGGRCVVLAITPFAMSADSNRNIL